MTIRAVPGNIDFHKRDIKFENEKSDFLYPDLPKQNFDLPEKTENINFIGFEQKPKKGMFNIAHFYRPDRLFWPIWNSPAKYLKKLKSFQAVCSPDFSLYMDDNVAVQLYSIYQSRWLTNYFILNEINVIHTGMWGVDMESEFLGLPTGDIFTVDTPNRKQIASIDSEAQYCEGLRELLRVAKPKKLLVYGVFNRIEKEVVEGTSYIEFKKDTVDRFAEK
jgi:hypothetical protein